MPQEKTKDSLPAALGRPVLVWGARLLLVICTLGLVGYLFVMFAQMMHNLGVNGAGNTVLAIAAWTVLIGSGLTGAWIYIKTAWLACWARVAVLLSVSVVVLYVFFGFFLSNHYYGIAAAFSARQMIDGALEYYQKAIEKNPMEVGYRQYRAYILRQTMDLRKTFSPVKGDKTGTSTDYDRALKDLKYVQKHAPNHALLHQALGEFYYTYAVLFSKLSQTAKFDFEYEDYRQKAVENLENAKKSFHHSLLLDPVNEATYVYLTSIALMEKNPAQAQEWIDAYRKGPAGVSEEEFLATHRSSARLDALEQRLREAPFHYFPDRK